jgi:Leucine-rich repeat (LRR) protein
MKYIITENQYRILLKEDRVQYLKTQNVIDPKLLDDAVDGEDEKDDKRTSGGMKPNKPIIEPIEDHNGVDIAYIVKNKKGKQSVKLSEHIFNDIVEADPSSNKQYVQWMIQVFMRHINEGDVDQAIRFLTEDLPEANEFLTVFDSVKNKKVFKRSAPNRPNAPQDVTNINQYNDLAHLYSVVSPFVGSEDEEDSEEGESRLWKKLKKYIDLGEAKLVYRDNDVLVYTPLTIESSCDPLGPLASWCTRREGNSYFESYRRNNPKPDGSLSEYYVIMPKKLFDGDDEGNLYPLQFHFESNQLHDKNNSSIERSGKLSEVLNRFPGLKTFFNKELGKLTEMDVKKGTGLMDSSYIKYLNMFGGSVGDVISPEIYQEGVNNIKKMASQTKGPLQSNKYLQWLMQNTEEVNIIDYLDSDNTTSLDFSGLSIKEIPDLSKFHKLERLNANNCDLKRLPPIEYLPNHENFNVFIAKNNNIKEVPLRGYEKLTNLFLLNLTENPITKFNLDVAMDMYREGNGSLVMLSISTKNLDEKGVEDFNKFLEMTKGDML